MKLLNCTLGALMAAGLITAAGCEEATTQRDVAKAKQDVRQEQDDVRAAAREGELNVAEAQRKAQDDANRQTVNKPIVNDNTLTEANQDIANAQRKANENVTEEKRDVSEAQAKLDKTQREARATQDRDTFITQIDQQLAPADQKIEQLEQQAKSASGAAKDQLDARIKTLKTERDHVRSLIKDMQHADLEKWDVHKQSVQAALADLLKDLNANR